MRFFEMLRDRKEIRAAFTLALLLIAFYMVTLPGTPLTEAAAIEAVQRNYPEMENYPGGGLPPRRIVSKQIDNDWFLSFEINGSGVPTVFEATCYKVEAGNKVTRTGTFKPRPIDSYLYSNINPETCKGIPDSN